MGGFIAPLNRPISIWNVEEPFLNAGGDAINSLKQAVQFGLNKRFHIAGAQQELEVLAGLPPEARIGTWVFEWYWNQPNVPHVGDFVTAIRAKNGGRVPTARHWFGYVATWTCALVANQQKTLDPVKLAKALEDFKLPPEIALMPDEIRYRAGDHQLMPDLYVGHAVEKGSEAEDVFAVDSVVKGTDVAPSVADTGCKLNYPL
jgi:branched-chain amino acid transport system substrate-binding protein